MKEPKAFEEAQVVGKSEQELANEFIREYEELCKKHGFQIIVVPAWKVSQDTGTWSTILQSSVGRLSQK